MNAPASEPKTKKKWPYADALAVADDLKARLSEFCERIEIAGSLRRKKAMVGDIELVYVSKTESHPVGLFGETDVLPIMNHVLDLMCANETLVVRKNVKGSETWGDNIKLATHIASGIPVDFFSTSEESWWNYLVCRTGPSESNIRICDAAIMRGWKWEPYSPGFVKRSSGERSPRMTSERDVFSFVGLGYFDPEHRT